MSKDKSPQAGIITDMWSHVIRRPFQAFIFKLSRIKEASVIANENSAMSS